MQLGHTGTPSAALRSRFPVSLAPLRSIMNVLDRCDRPRELLVHARRLLKPEVVRGSGGNVVSWAWPHTHTHAPHTHPCPLPAPPPPAHTPHSHRQHRQRSQLSSVCPWLPPLMLQGRLMLAVVLPFSDFVEEGYVVGLCACTMDLGATWVG